MLRCAIPWALALIVTTGCNGAEPRARADLSDALPTVAAVVAEVQAKDLLVQLAAAKAATEDVGLPTLCKAADKLQGTRALVATRDALHRLEAPSLALTDVDRALTSKAILQLGAGEDIVSAIDRVQSHRYLVVLHVERHRAPRRKSDRVVSMGRLRGRMTLVDMEQSRALCRADLEASTSKSSIAYGPNTEETVSQELFDNFLTAAAAQLRQSGSGLTLAHGERQAS